METRVAALVEVPVEDEPLVAYAPLRLDTNVALTRSLGDTCWRATNTLAGEHYQLPRSAHEWAIDIGSDDEAYAVELGGRDPRSICLKGRFNLAVYESAVDGSRVVNRLHEPGSVAVPLEAAQAVHKY